MQNIKHFLLLCILCCLAGVAKGQFSVDLPQTETLCENSDYILYVQPSDNMPQSHTIEWQEDTGTGFTTLLTATGATSYVLSNLNSGFDGNEYRAIMDGTDTSMVLTITMSTNTPNIANTITDTPLDVCIGEDITVGALLIGGAGPSGPFTWYIGTDINSLRIFSTEGINGSNFPADVTVSNVMTDSLVVVQFRKGSGNPPCFSRIDTATIFVNSPPSPSAGTYSDVCINDAPFQLMGSNPSGGTFSGSAVFESNGDYFFDPPAAQVGANSVDYSVVASGCSATVSTSITVLDTPTVQGPSTQILARSLCIDGSALSLLDGSPGNGIWTDSTGAVLTSFTPQTYGIGLHVLTYRFTAVNTCTGTDTINLRVNDLPNVDAGNAQTVCINSSPINLGGSPSGGIWSTSSNGLSGNVFTPSQAGLGSHTLTYAYTDANGCENSDTKEITVADIPPDPSAVAVDTCTNADLLIAVSGTAGGIVCLYNSPSGGTPIVCDTLDGSGNGNLQFAPTVVGGFTVYIREEVVGACNSDMFVLSTTILDPPDPPTITDNPACEGTTTILTVTSSVTNPSFQWYTDPQLSNQVGSGNNYTTLPLSLGTSIYATVQDPATGCSSNADVLQVTVYENPSAVISPVKVEECDQVAHELSASASSDGTGTITSVFWDFGDQATDTITATLQDLVSHTYPGPDTFTVRLTVIDDLGCTGQTTEEVIVIPLPERIAPEVLDSTLCVNAGPTPLPTPINGYSYDWEGECVTQDDEFDPSCEPGTIMSAVAKALSVEITDDNGCVNQFQHTFFINPIPIADFQIDNTCLKTEFSPVDLSLNQPDDWFWIIDGGNDTTAGSVPVFEFENSADIGSHSLLLIVNTDGCKDSLEQTFEVYDIPDPAFPLPAQPCPGEEVEFDGSNSKANSGGDLSYIWDFGEGMGTASGIMPSYSFFLSDTSLTISLTLGEEVEAGLVCFSTLNKNLEIRPKPTASLITNATGADPCFTHPVEFEDLSTEAGGISIIERVWNPGDGTGEEPVQLSAFSYTYGLPDPLSSEVSYVATLKVTDQAGCVDVDSLEVTVDYSGPTVNDEPLKLGRDLLVSRDDAPDVSYEWYRICNEDTSLAPGDNTRQFYCVKEEDRQCDFFVITRRAGSGCETTSNAGRVEGREGLPLEVFFSRGITLFPNPNTGSFTLELLHEVEGIGQIRIVDLTGRQVFEEVLEKNGTLFTQKINPANLPSKISEGIYIVEVRFADGVWFSQKMMVR